MKPTFFALFLLLTLLLCACTPQADYFDVFRCGFEAEIVGTLRGVHFSALFQAQPCGDEGARALTVTFYAPAALSGTTVEMRADGSCCFCAGALAVEQQREALAPLLTLFPTDAAVRAVERNGQGHTEVRAQGVTVTFLADGTPVAITAEDISVQVIRFVPLP